MKSYLIVRETDPNQFTIEGEFDTRAEAVKASKQLDTGTYSLLSVLRANFTVRISQRVVQNVVDWGTTLKPRPRKAKTPKAPKVAKSTKSNGKETVHVSA